MAFMKRITGAVALGAALLVGAGLSAPPAQAGYVATLTEQAGNLVASGSGAIDLTGLRSLFPPGIPPEAIPSPAILPNPAFITIGLFAPVDSYTGTIVGPSNFGSGTSGVSGSGTGDEVGLNTVPSTLPRLFVPFNYVSQTNLSNTATFVGQTFTTAGVTPGTYEWTWGSGPNQNFTLIAKAAAVPEPSSLLLLGGALAGLLLVCGRRRNLDAG